MFYRVKIIQLIFIVFIGLLLVSCFGQSSSLKDVKGPITFAEHIAPIIYTNCAKCHQNGEAGPFTLTSYHDVAKRAKLIKYVTEHRIMPPWPADPTYSNFANELYLTDAQINLIKRWVDEGLHAGDTINLKVPELVGTDLQLGTPDLIVRLPKLKIPGNNTDLFTVMKIPYEIKQDTFVRAIEIVCGNKRLVHHMNGHLVQFDARKKQHINEGKSWVNQNKTQSNQIHRELGLLHDDGTYPALTPSVSNYLPGALFSLYPKEIGGYKMSKKGAFYLNDMHFGPTPIDAYDSSYFKIYFSATPPKRPISEFQIGTLGIVPVVPELVVPPNKVKTFNIKATIPNDISIVSIVPHMHLIGKSFLAYAIKPSGDTIPLIRINKWDFRWQYFYQFKTLLKLSRGTTIYVEGVYDNTASNPNNPFNPPQEIKEREGSMKTTDEMFQLIITYVPYLLGDENISLEKITP
jgi:hypothetical protein